MPRHQRRVAVAAAALICVGSAFGPVVTAQADGTSSFYVNNAAGTDCSDSTTNTSITPYCTIQAAVDAATTPGDTVIVSPGTYAPFTVTASGTADAPITIESTSGLGFSPGPGPYTSITATAGMDTTAVTLNGASGVVIKGLRIIQSADASALAVTGGSADTVTDSFMDQESARRAHPVVSLSSNPSAITLSRNQIQGGTGGGIAVQGGSKDIITTNSIASASGHGIVLDAAPSSEITSNTLSGACGVGIGLADGSSAASVENNVVSTMVQPSACGSTVTTEVPLSVDSTSTDSTTADYNVLVPDLGPTGTNVYAWASTYYSTPAAFNAASGQGAHDTSSTLTTAKIDSADSDAPGELSTDIYGRTRVDDPKVANTGSGAYDYYDRGAPETVDPITFTPVNWPATAPVDEAGTYSATVSDSWGYQITGCTYDFGDGSALVTVTPDASGLCSTQHAYAATGAYVGQVVINVGSGAAYARSISVGVVAAKPLTPELTTTANGPLGVTANSTGTTDSWDITSCPIDFGDGSAPQVLNANSCAVDHTYAKPGTYTVTTTVVDSGGNQESATSTFTTTAAYFTPVTPTRILDTRKGIGVTEAGAIAPNSSAKLKIAGVDGLPQTGVTAVALNVTATEATKLGVITAYPDGQARPGVSNLDFHANQNVANTVIVAVGADGYVDLANVSAGTTHIIVDLEGYYTATGSSGFNAVTPTRILDTRKTTAIPAGATVKVNLSSYTGISAAMLNLTVVSPTGNGYITASPDGGTTPTTSNVNYLTGQTVPNEALVAVGKNGYVDFTNTGKGTAQLIVDLDGYFTTGTGDYFAPISPTRYLDTRNGTGGLRTFSPQETAGVIIGQPTPGAAVPLGATAIAANLTVVSPTANGYITVFPTAGSTVPNSSVLNFLTGQQTQNAITVGLDSNLGEFTMHNASNGYTNLIVDVTGYYGATTPPAAQ